MEIELPRPISRVVFRCSESTTAALLPKMQIHEGAILSDELLRQARETAKAYNERIAILVHPPAHDDGVNVVIFDPAVPPQRIRVDGSEQETRLIEKTAPIEARGERAVVKLAVIVGREGTVIEVDPLAGPEALIPSAVNAVRAWKYKPTLLNGRPVEVETTVEVAF
jgi:hypothetical protein